jgi:hypothetical protein
MTEVAQLVTRNPQFQEQHRSKLQDAVSGILPAKLEQEIADALKMDMERRAEPWCSGGCRLLGWYPIYGA